ncbi:MAG: glycosyltransferase family 4 protein [Bryobacteraceae bacterium]|nr:glycosyltransferase family 4 protein [Bryobacteraceae bacterium]
MLVLYSAAHGGYAGQPVPLGGGAAIANQLMAEWSRTQPFNVQLLDPSILGPSTDGLGAPTGEQLVQYSEKEYAAFCHCFDAAVTEHILRHDPKTTRVLINDISEAPVFPRLAERGFIMHSIYHVDVVAYVANIYGKGYLSPANLVKLYDRFGSFYPSIAKLVFEKQRQSLKYSRSVIVPSASMKQLLLECYPDTPADRIRVLPWGHSLEEFPEEDIAIEIQKLRDQYRLHPRVPTLLCLSRISPEKGQDLLLEAIAEWETQEDFPANGLNLVICGEAAYMMGQRYLEKLKSLARKLTRTNVVFPGFVMGIRKRAFFGLADLYVFPSRHESYGLTLVEALAAGLPAVTLEHDGARALMRPEFGIVAIYRDLVPSIAALLKDPERRQRMGAAAKAWAGSQRFSDTARTLAEWIQLPVE